MSQTRYPLPDRLMASLFIAAGFMAFLVFDQSHWWQLKPDYAFGWLVPIFVVYLVYERWPTLLQMLAGSQSPKPALIGRWVANGMVGCIFIAGLTLFGLGAFYRARAGATQPGSLSLAVGFSGILIGLIYFSIPAAELKQNGYSGVTMAKLKIVSLFVFPALIWILSAPLVTAVENAISLMLLRRVVSVVFAVFNFLGYTIVREGNVLVLPLGRVGVEEACSGIRSLTGCLFAGSFLAAVFLKRFWQKVALIFVAMGFAFLMNLLRSLFLTAWAYAYGSDAIEGRLHDATGYAVLGLTVIGLFLFLPLFHLRNWQRWLGYSAVPSAIRHPLSSEQNIDARR